MATRYSAWFIWPWARIFGSGNPPRSSCPGHMRSLSYGFPSISMDGCGGRATGETPCAAKLNAARSPIASADCTDRTL